MPKRYRAEFHRRVLDLLDADRSVAEVASNLGIPNQTIDVWRRHEQIDRGLTTGLTSTDQAEHIGALRRIKELDTELAVARRAVELMR